jgi:hypothetical protein
MQLKLKEHPREWQKFTAVMAVLFALVAFVAHRRAGITRETFSAVTGAAVGAVILSLILPRLFRPFYRGGMTVSFHIGQVMGKLLLTVVFVLVLTPLALVLRAMGKDLLRLKRDPSAQTFWQPAKNSKEFDRMF